MDMMSESQSQEEKIGWEDCSKRSCTATSNRMYAFCSSSVG